MTLPNTALLPTAKIPTVPQILHHDAVALDKVQRRLSGRTVLVPRVNLNAYRYRALIDWIEFRVHLGRPTQVQHVQSVLRQFLSRDSHIAPEDKGPGDVFAICTIRVQEPASLALITNIYQSLVDTFGEAAGSRVTGIEISIDAYPRKVADTARATLMGTMQRTIWTGRDIWSNSDSRPRSIFGRRKKDNFKLSPGPEMDGSEKSRSVPENHMMPVIDGTMYLGPKDGAVMIRVMDKVIDGQRPDGTFIALKDDRKRVRVEVAVTGTELFALGLTDIASLKRLKLTTMQKRYFQFRLPTFSERLALKTGADVLHNTKQMWRARTYLRSGVTGLMAMDAATALHQKKMKRGIQKTLRTLNLVQGRMWAGKRLAAPFVSWNVMNRKVHLALRDLEKREMTAWQKMSP